MRPQNVHVSVTKGPQAAVTDILNNHHTRLWGLRHGESRANVEQIVVSRPGPRAFEWASLTDLGRQQVEETSRVNHFPSDTLLITSDFARAYETAQIAAEAWGAHPPRIDSRLRERDFGSLEDGPAARYDEVWTADFKNGGWPDGVETPQHVAARIRALVESLIDDPEGDASEIVLVAHGDVLQIAEAWLRGHDPSQHRSLPHLLNAELRLLTPNRA